MCSHLINVILPYQWQALRRFSQWTGIHAPLWPLLPLLVLGIFERCFMQHATAHNEQHQSAPVTLATLSEFPASTELRSLLTLSESGITALVKAGVLPPPVIKAGRIRRWSKAAVLASLQQQGAK